MPSEEVELLLEDYAARFARGEGPDVREYLARAGAGRDELATLIDAFLAHAAPRDPDAETIESVRAWMSGKEPLLALRTRRRLRVDEVVTALMSALGLDDAKRAKVKRYYQQLETGLLEPGRVDGRVYEALSRVLRAKVAELAALRPTPLQTRAAYFRAEPPLADVVSSPAAEPEEPDEVDALFRGADGPSGA